MWRGGLLFNSLQQARRGGKTLGVNWGNADSDVRAGVRPPLQENAQMSDAQALMTADGHSAEAETAANEAAREARAEVIEQAEAPKRADAPATKAMTGEQKSAAKDA